MVLAVSVCETYVSFSTTPALSTCIVLRGFGVVVFFKSIINSLSLSFTHIVQELCESRGGHPGLSVLTSLLVSVDVKIY